MSEHTDWQFAVEIHPFDWCFPVGPTWLAGWIFGGESRFVTDLRGWIDGRPCLALHGLPRREIDEGFLRRPGPPYCGFSLLVHPHRGATLLRLEVRETDGRWVEFFRTAIVVADAAPACPPPTALSTQVGFALPAVLRRHGLRPEQPLAALADDVVSAALSEPLNTLPNPPFHGALEEPLTTGRIRYGRLAVAGWLAHRTGKIMRITALADAVGLSVLQHGLPRADISEVFADLPGREHAQFAGYVDLPYHQNAPVLLKIFAEMEDGEMHLVFAQRFTPRVIAGADAPWPPLSRVTFARALWALRNSAQRHGLPLGNYRLLCAATRDAWAEYHAEAPGHSREHHLARLPVPVFTGAAPLRVLLATHNLNFEGAPWFIFELGRFFAAQPKCTVRVISSQDGPLRGVFEKAGMTVALLDLSAALCALNTDGFHTALQSVAARINWREIDLVVANTMVAFWAVHLARAAGKPSLLYVHESTPIRRFFEPLLPPALFPAVEEAFRRATRVVFTADATRRVHAHLNTHGQFALLPSWVDVTRVDAFLVQHDRVTLRKKHSFDPDAVLVVNIGSICERKGQHVFLHAIALLKAELAATYPQQKIQFLMVGARPGVYLNSLQQEARLLGLDHALFLPETGEIYDFYRLADIFVCTSFEESFPRVLLESAAFRLPIVSTNVNGIAEMLADDEAWLIPPGDRHQLAVAMKHALAAYFRQDTTRPDRARDAIARRFHEAISLPRHFALAREVANLHP